MAPPIVVDTERISRRNSYSCSYSRCHDGDELPEIYLDDDGLIQNHVKRRNSFASLTQIFQPAAEDDSMSHNINLYSVPIPTSEVPSLNDMLAKFRPVRSKKHNQDQDDAALFAYIEKRSVPTRRPSNASTSSFSLSSFMDGFDDDDLKSRCGSLSDDLRSRCSLSSFWSNLGLDLDPGSAQEVTPFEEAVKKCPSKRGNAVYRRGKMAADAGEWEKAVHCYHIALVKQRSYYGEDHVRTAETLNSLGLALIELEEYFGAITALEECLHIQQDVLGPGAEECVVTTNNICRVLDCYQGQGQAMSARPKIYRPPSAATTTTVFQCEVCCTAVFKTYDECLQHEQECAESPPQSQRNEADIVV